MNNTSIKPYNPHKNETCLFCGRINKIYKVDHKKVNCAIKNCICMIDVDGTLGDINDKYIYPICNDCMNRIYSNIYIMKKRESIRKQRRRNKRKSTEQKEGLFNHNI